MNFYYFKIFNFVFIYIFCKILFVLIFLYFIIFIIFYSLYLLFMQYFRSTNSNVMTRREDDKEGGPVA